MANLWQKYQSPQALRRKFAITSYFSNYLGGVSSAASARDPLRFGPNRKQPETAFP
jgi:hypothetical protein